MIHKVSANNKLFHAVEFKKGLNLIVAEPLKTSTIKDTCNGVGKSTLIEIIDFCLGSDHTREDGLVSIDLIEWAFTLDITIGESKVEVTRSVKAPLIITIKGATPDWPYQPEVDDDAGTKSFTLKRWNELLGIIFFGIEHTNNMLNFKPSYRSLFAYFIRRKQEAYTSPFKTIPQMNKTQEQSNIAYLLNLNWKYACELHAINKEISGIINFKKAKELGLIDEDIKSTAKLETECVKLEKQVAISTSAIDSFNVHSQYEEIENYANKLTEDIHQLSNNNISDKLKLNRYKTAIKEENPPSELSIENLYNEAGVIFSDLIKKTLQDAKKFHSDIITNRHSFLNNEINVLKNNIKLRKDKIKELDKERAQQMDVLQTHGALNEYIKLQDEHISLRTKLEDIQNKLNMFENACKIRREKKNKKEELINTATLEYKSSKDIWSIPISLFYEFSSSLYESPGSLIIEVNNKGTGYHFDTEIESKNSSGKGKMQIFCFDLILQQLQLKQKNHIDFLIHDSLLYDSADRRQRYQALTLVKETLKETNGQYICTINSDMLDSTAIEEFKDDICLKLNDNTQSNKLLGIQFERKMIKKGPK